MFIFSKDHTDGFIPTLTFFFFFFSSLAYIYFFPTLAPWHKLPNNSLASEDKTCLVCFSHNWFSHLIRSPWGEITRHQNKLLTTKQLISLMPVSLVTKMSEEADTCSLRDIDYSLHQQCKGQYSISELHNTIKTSTSSLSLCEPHGAWNVVKQTKILDLPLQWKLMDQNNLHCFIMFTTWGQYVTENLFLNQLLTMTTGSHINTQFSAKIGTVLPVSQGRVLCFVSLAVLRSLVWRRRGKVGTNRMAVVELFA